MFDRAAIGRRSPIHCHKQGAERYRVDLVVTSISCGTNNGIVHRLALASEILDRNKLLQEMKSLIYLKRKHMEDHHAITDVKRF